MSLRWVEFRSEDDGDAVLYLFVVMLLRALGFRVDSRSVEVLRDVFGRPISLDLELVDTTASELWETDSSFPEISSALESFMEKGHGRQVVFRRRYPQT